MEKGSGVHAAAQHLIGDRDRRPGNGQRRLRGAVRLNHERIARMMRLANQGVVWIGIVRRVVAIRHGRTRYPGYDPEVDGSEKSGIVGTGKITRSCNS